MKHERLIIIVPTLILLLACAPGFWGDGTSPAALSIAPDWQCPTPSPIPTRLAGYEPTQPPVDPAATADPATTAVAIYTTAAPTASPYVRTGSDYFQNQRINVNNQLFLLVTSYRSTPAVEAGLADHQISLEIDNRTSQAIAIFFDSSQIRAIRRSDGRMVQGTWAHDQRAAAALGIAPASDPEIDIDDQKRIVGGYPPGMSRRTLVFRGPAGEAQAWGISLGDGGATHRDGGAGDGQIWVMLRNDPNCVAGPGGGASEPGGQPPAGTPVNGPGGWPVPLDTPISRSYGCHAFFTGVHGSCPNGLWWHDGIDFASPKGTPLFAVRDISVSFAGADTSTIDCSWIDGSDPPHKGFGQYVKASDAYGYTYWYGHVSRWRVSAGQQVKAGSQVADMGSTGCSTGSHLHFRIRLNGLDRNPYDVIRK